jgi:hypothetical protein
MAAFLLLLLALPAGVCLAVPYLVLAAALGRPPVVPSLARSLRVLKRALGPVPAPGLSIRARTIVLLALARRLLLSPMWAMAWWADELLWGRRLDAVVVERPVFEVSAARSGSTQLARHLETHRRLSAPGALQSALPFLWAWRLASLAPGLAPAVRWLVERTLPDAFLDRHELEPFRVDTLEVMFYGWHLGDLVAQLGPDPFVRELSNAELTAENADLWLLDFVAYADRLGRKVLLRSGGRLLLKGHFLPACDALAARHPDATFVTMLRDPADRVRSTINFHHEQPGEPGLQRIPWPWVIERALRIELPYDDAERAFYGAGPNRIVVRFDDFVLDPQAVVDRVVRELGEPPLGTIEPRQRRPRRTPDRTLEELLSGYDASGGDADVAARAVGLRDRIRREHRDGGHRLRG